MAIVGEKLRNYVINQIEARQKKLSPSYQKTDTDLVYFNSKTSWIKMASGVSINEDKLKEIGLGKDIKKLSGTGLAKNHILFGGTAAHDGDSKSLLVKEMAYKLIRNDVRIGIISLEESIKRTCEGIIGLHLNKPIHIDRKDIIQKF